MTDIFSRFIGPVTSGCLENDLSSRISRSGIVDEEDIDTVSSSFCTTIDPSSDAAGNNDRRRVDRRDADC